MDSIIRLACIAYRTAYWRHRRPLQTLGIEHMSVSELQRYAQAGVMV